MVNRKSNLLIFDMDGVLIDVTGSYREVVRQTVLIYLKDVLGLFIKNEKWITLKDIDNIKKGGGLNNDWDLTYAILNVILTEFFDRYNKDFINRVKNIVSGDIRFTEEEVLKIIASIKSNFNKRVIEKSLQLINLVEIYEKGKASLQSSYFLFNQGDVGSGNIIKRIFQEIYLGKKLFSDIYGLSTIFYNKSKGLIENEKLIPDKDIIVDLSKNNVLGIATGRPAEEALYALKRFELDTFFRALVTEDDINEAEKKMNKSLRKPHPFIIHECIKRINWLDKNRVYYIGDMPDDIEASLRAGVNPIGFVYEKGKTRDEVKKHIDILRKKGAKTVITDIAMLRKYVVT